MPISDYQLVDLDAHTCIEENGVGIYQKYMDFIKEFVATQSDLLILSFLWSQEFALKNRKNHKSPNRSQEFFVNVVPGVFPENHKTLFLINKQRKTPGTK